MNPKFEATDDGLEIIDPIERHRYRLTTHESVDPEPVDTDRIQFPVDSAIEITADTITLPTNDTVYVRDKDGSMIAEVRPNKQVSLDQNEYTLDLSGPLKVYANVDSSVHVYSDSEQTYINFDGLAETVIGARSYHRRPAGTITTTADPNDIMKTVSVFGSALKTLTPERSYPTHRGHPPAVELADDLRIPEEFERPDTGVQIEVPSSLEYVFTISPLAYYLGAEVIPGPKPKLITSGNKEYSLESSIEFEKTVGKLLRKLFFLDCIVRTEGTTPLPLHERQVVEPKLDFDIGRTYNQSLSNQIETYLSVPFDVVEPYLPSWRLEARLSPTGDMTEFLPFVADDLATVIVQKEEGGTTPDVDTQARAIDEFTRSSKTTRSTESNSNENIRTTSPSISQHWRDNGSTDIESTVPLTAFYNSLGRTPRETPLEIVVICNDSNMSEEIETVNNVYGSRDKLPFDVTIHHETTTRELEFLLKQESDFIHYIGHIDQHGIECSEGKLDASSIEEVGTKAFLLNACQSHEQGLQLVEAGSLGGIVTFGDVVNSGAIRVGNTIARLLNQGFPLYAALDIVQKETVIGQQYQIVGDGKTTIAQSKTGAPNVCILNKDPASLTVRMGTYISAGTEKGSMFTPYIEEIDKYYLLPGMTDCLEVTESQIEEFFSLQNVPVLIDGSVEWSDTVEITDL